MRKNLLTTVFAAILLVFIGCSSDDSKCNKGAVLTEFEAAADKYKASKLPKDCTDAVAIIKKNLASGCITQEEADSYGAQLDCYTPGSNDPGAGDCNQAALEAEFEAAVTKYKASDSPADCLAAVDIIKKALANKCITQAEADFRASENGLDCYTPGSNDPGDDTSNPGEETGDCATLKAAANAALAAYNANKTEANCHTAAQAIVDAWDADCISDAQAMQMGGDLPCAGEYL